MYRPFFTWSILFTAVITISSKSINTGRNEDIESALNGDSLGTTLSPLSEVQGESESNSKLGNKRSFSILVPTIEEEENAEYESQKSKRCRTPLLGERAPTILGSKHTEDSDIQQAEDSLGQNSNTNFVSLKAPTTPVPLTVLREKAKNITFRDEDLINSLRKQLTPNSPIVGSARRLPKTNIIDDDNFICYCREKSNPSKKVAENNGDIVPKAQPHRNKTERRLDAKKLAANSKARAKTIQHTRQPSMSNGKLPKFYSNVPHYAGYIPNSMYPISPQKGHPAVPYVPYLYHLNPRVGMSRGDAKIPTKNNIPLNSVANRPDSIVGQSISKFLGNANKPGQTIGQTARPPNIVGSSLPQPPPSQEATPATSKMPSEGKTVIDKEDPSSYDSRHSSMQSVSATNTGEDPTEANSDYNLQSPHTNVTPREEIESPSEIPNVQVVNPATNIEELSTGLGSQYGNEYETTGSGTVDYSDIKEVTTAYFTSRAYDETGHGGSGYGDFHVSSSGTMNTDPVEHRKYNVNLQNRLNDPTESSSSLGEIEEDTERLSDTNPEYRSEAKGSGQGNEDQNNMVGKSNPKGSQEEPASDDANLETNPEDGEGNADDNSESKEYSEKEEASGMIPEDSSPPDEDTSTTVYDTTSDQEYSEVESPEATDNTSAPDNFEEEEETSTDDYMPGETIPSEYDYESVDDTKDEEVEAGQEETIQEENGDNLESSNADGTVGMKNPLQENQTLPFCDNTLLQKSIKTVINNFATSDSSERDDNEETVGASKGEDLLPEIVRVPNLKGILSMPQIEKTIIDKVKDALSKTTGMDRRNFDNDWATNVIKNNLRNMLSAAPVSQTEIPPLAVKERQFKDGKWVTDVVTLEPPLREEAKIPTELERLQGNIKSILRHPAVSMQAAKHPAVKNMIVESVRNTFNPENAEGRYGFNDSVIQSTLNNELSNIQAEDEEITTTEGEHETTTFDMSNIDMDKILDIAKNEAGMTDEPEDESSSTLRSLASERNQENANNSEETLAATTESLNNGVVGAARDPELSEQESNLKESSVYPTKEGNQDAVELSEENEDSKASAELGVEESKAATLSVKDSAEEPKYNSNVATTVGSKESATEIEDYSHKSVGDGSPTMNPTENADAPYGKKAESEERSVEMTNTRSSTELHSNDASSAQDFTYLGKITVKNGNKKDDVQSLRNSELFYVGDGVKLPLEIRKLRDGSYALSISRKVCEHLLNKECPCCVPLAGNVVRTVKRNSGVKNADRTVQSKKKRRISKRNSEKSILSSQEGKRDSADDSLQIFSMPVETFARRYNLSLNLEKVQTPWNFDAIRKIDEASVVRARSLKSKADNAKEGGAKIIAREWRINNNAYEDNEATNYKEYQGRKGGNPERYRYQRNINEGANKRVEIIKTLLNWLRDMILNSKTDR